LIFEWHPYGTLHDFLKDNKNEQGVSTEKMLQYSISLTDGLAHLHSIKYGTHGMIKEYSIHVLRMGSGSVHA
jgi:hypothetical protein